MEQTDPETEELLRGARLGDPSATTALLDRHRARLSRMVQFRLDTRVRGRVDPSDVVQETLLAASQKLAQYLVDEPIPFYPWLRQIAWEKLVHLHDRHLRAAKRNVGREGGGRPELPDASVDELLVRLVGRETTPSQVAMLNEQWQQVRAALDQLQPADREVLLMRYLEHLTSKEIAAIVGTSEAAVNMRHMRALERLRKLLGCVDGLE